MDFSRLSLYRQRRGGCKKPSDLFMERDLGEIFPCRHSRCSFHQDGIFWIHLTISIFDEDVRLLRLKDEASTRQGSDQPRRIEYKYNHQAPILPCRISFHALLLCPPPWIQFRRNLSRKLVLRVCVILSPRMIYATQYRWRPIRGLHY